MTLSDDEEESPAQFLESEILSEASDQEEACPEVPEAKKLCVKNDVDKPCSSSSSSSSKADGDKSVSGRLNIGNFSNIDQQQGCAVDGPEVFMGSGRFARAYELGYNCADEKELNDTLRFCRRSQPGQVWWNDHHQLKMLTFEFSSVVTACSPLYKI